MGSRFRVKSIFKYFPDGIFSYQKFQFGYTLEGFGMENVGIFYGNLE
jgi:hypothetical protein